MYANSGGCRSPTPPRLEAAAPPARVPPNSPPPTNAGWGFGRRQPPNRRVWEAGAPQNKAVCLGGDSLPEFMDVTKPYEVIGLGAMDVTKPYEFIGFGAMDVTKPYVMYMCKTRP